MEFLEQLYTNWIPYLLILVMGGMGLSLTLLDLKSIFAKPKAVIAGLAAQLILLPLIAIALGYLYASPAFVAAGAIILAACPGGVTSNAYVFASRADIALSVSLTSLSSLITVFTIPLVTLLALQLHYDGSTAPAVPVTEMMWTLARMTILPIAVGMAIRAWKPEFALRVIEPLRTVTLWLLILIVVMGTWSAWENIVAHFWNAGFLMITINLTGMAVGYAIGKLLKLPFSQVATIMFEVGVQNLSMALLVTLTLLKSPELAIATLIYALFMKISAMSLVWYVRRRPLSEASTASVVDQTRQ
jgi:BASS family bile acid:Na+ symporter